MNIYEELAKWETSTGTKLFEKMKIPKNAKIIDFGCGYGENAVALAHCFQKAKIYAIDIDKNAIKALEKKIKDYSLKNIIVIENKKEQKIGLEDNFADLVLLYDMIHANDLKTKMPVRFQLYEEVFRVLKQNGILSIAPFSECNNLKDKNGKYKKYTKEKIIEELTEYGFCFESEYFGAIHFEKSRSPYQWKKFNNNMQFGDIEKGPIWNFVKR